MFLQCTSRDLCTLPQQLLPSVKEHVRVEFDRDDEYLVQATARAISEIEAATNLSIFEAEWLWRPSACDNWRSWFEVPKIPVCIINYEDGTPIPVDKLHGSINSFNVSAVHVSGLPTQNIYLKVGYANAAQISPNLLSAILMLVGTLYENRESAQYGSMRELPDSARRLITGLWVPSV